MAAPQQFGATRFLREGSVSDTAFLRRLFAETATRLPGLPPQQVALFQDMQFRGRQLTYSQRYPDAVEYILLHDGETAAGCLLVAPAPGSLRIVDLAVLSEYRRQGLATAALLHLQERACQDGRRLDLRVQKTNLAALALYGRVGFQTVAEDSLDIEMSWYPIRMAFDTSFPMEAKKEVPWPEARIQLPPDQDSASNILGDQETALVSSRKLLFSRFLLKTLKKAGGIGGTLFFAGSLAASAQGILTVTPSQTVTTTAGTGQVGYSGDSGPAASATLASPSAVAYDAQGNLFIADTSNHVIREVAKSNGAITTVAGNGIAGFSGDGGAAISAQLDTPTGIAVDTSGNLYIADSHNQRIREVSGGTITTVAGNGTAGFSGDGSAATSAELDLPSSVAVDASGSLYIADTDNQRIRKVSGGTITTLAGTGEQNYAGDGGAATSATLDTPTGIAVDSAGNVYIADRHNQRIREVSGGTIATLAGSGPVTFAGGYAGDGANATAASLSKPTGVSVDAAGNVYIADTNNQRVREVTAGTIATVEGDGQQGFDADGNAATATALNEPTDTATDAAGNLAIADSLNDRIRMGGEPALAFGSSSVGLTTAAQSITLGNTGSGPLTVAAPTLSGPFTLAPGGTCSDAPITLAAGASCTQDIAFRPTAAGAASGSIALSGSGVVTQMVLLTGTGVQATTDVTLISSMAALFVNEPITFTATVAPTVGTAVPNGTVTFYANGTSLGTEPLSGGSGSITTSFATAGSYAITAEYTGNDNFSTSTSATLTQLVGDFNFTIANSGNASQTVNPGDSVTFPFTVAPLNGPFTFPITLSATGLPPGATVSFNPSAVTLESSPVMFTMTVQTAETSAALRKFKHLGPLGETMLALLLLLPFTTKQRRRSRQLKLLLMLVVSVLGLGSMAALSGCGSNSGFFGEPQNTYTIQIFGTATGANGASLQHVTTVRLTVE
ncbi:GNAT family N-acetyltransferase [Granulicella sp. 5B5]|uniref:GNAT family N-acetyltransferase n=1 Tax=Granulicella sp. 5B5 TaxID=1617967 RepID=UPI0015F4788F|nr:GNAT family N-acetyltransferase [Granulicella sp. 5B5]QMV19926.1 GNAT family N-acetyltransferase [Granulicella sp. 5B5]